MSRNTGDLASSKDLLLRKMLEKMKSYTYCKNYTHDKKMINFFEKSLVRMLQLNSAFHLDFTSAKQLVSKLSSITMRDKYMDALDDLRYNNKDTHGVNNYVKTLQEIMGMARVAVDDKLDVR